MVLRMDFSRGGIGKEQPPPPTATPRNLMARTFAMFGLIANSVPFLIFWMLPGLVWERHTNYTAMKWLYPVSCYLSWEKYEVGLPLVATFLAFIEYAIYGFVF